MARNSFTGTDEHYMRRALSLAARAAGMTSPNPMVGAVIVKQKRIVGEGYHRRAGLPHAEIEAIKNAGSESHGATLYVTLEPCVHFGKTPPCADAIVAAGIRRVVTATTDPNPQVGGKGLRRLRRSGVNVSCGLLRNEARQLNEFFFTYHLEQRPFVILKWAMSLDGRTSTETGDSKWISNDTSREYVHRLRSRVDALLVGSRTVIKDDPLLNVRLRNYRGVQPTRIILDYSLETPERARCLDPTTGGETWIVTHKDSPPGKITRLEKQGVKVFRVPGKKNVIDIEHIMNLLHNQQVLSIMVEGGRRVAGSFLASGVVDKIISFVAPCILGGMTPTSPVICPGIPCIKEALRLEDTTITQFGTDVCIEGYIRKPRLSQHRAQRDL